jgi:hypothetical protein
MSKMAKIIIIVGAAMMISGFMIGDASRNKVVLFLEKDTIEQTVRSYLNAEIKKDSRQVYDLLAPSSDYRKSHTYEEYLKDVAEIPPLSINQYKIIRIYRLRDNDNRQNYPGVDKFVQVEVEVTFTHAGPNTVYNYSFTFLKEKGKWYKG